MSAIPIKKKINYLNNKDIMKEIHKSKSSYCSFTDKKLHADYDVIVSSIDEITPESVTLGRTARAERLAKEEFDEASLTHKCKIADFYIDPETINASEVVFRVMMWDHIPIDEVKQKKANAKAQEGWDKENADEEIDDGNEPVVQIVAPAKYVKVNFPPFQHYVVDAENLTPVLVGKSHWKGDLMTGAFDKDHGKLTNKLALMYMKLCERYGMRFNWRNYTYNEEMQSQALLQLSQVGLQFNEAKSSNPFSYFTMVMLNSFRRVLNVEKTNQSIRDDILEMNGLTPSYTRQGQWSSSGASSDE